MSAAPTLSVARGRRTRAAVLLAAALGAALGGRAPAARAQRPTAPAPAPALQFRHLGVDDGLPSSLVSDIVRDRRGFMWLGTARGVSRYDGYGFRNYARGPGALPGDMVAQVYEDRRGTIWVVTAEGVSRYDAARDAFTTYMTDRPGGPAARPRIVTSVVEDPRGAFWVGTSAGVYRLDRATGRATRIALPTLAGGEGAPSESGPYVYALYTDRRGRVWVGARDGLYVLTAAGDAARVYRHDPADRRSLPDSTVRALAEDARGGLWVGTSDGGLARLDEAAGRFETFRHDPADPRSLAWDRVVRLVADRGGAGLWVGTENGGLDYLQLGTRSFAHQRFDPNRPSGIGSNSIWSLYQGEDGALWVGTFSGGVDVSLPNGGAIRRYTTVAGDSSSLSYNAVPAFAEDRAGGVWVGTDGGGLNRLDPATGQFARYPLRKAGLRSDAVIGVHVDRAGAVWAATYGGGLARFDARRGRFRAYTVANSNIPSNNLYEVVEDRAGRLWVGSENAYAAQFDPERGRFVRRFRVVAPGLEPSAVVQLRELRDGTLAFGLLEGGVALLDPATGARTHFVAGGPGALASNHVNALLEDEAAGQRGEGALWVGTDRGLDRLDRRTGRFTHYGPEAGVPAGPVEGILTDAAGALWLSTEHGLVRFDPARRTARTYTRADGVHGDEFVMRSAFRAHDGTLYFGGNQGFTSVRPDGVADAPRVPAVALTGLQLFNRPVAVGAPGSPLTRALDATEELTLTHAQNVVTFEFAAPDYGAARRTRYAYRLDGFDAGWQDVGLRRTASYTNLAPGRYTFRARATTGAEWSGEGTAVRLVVLPPWWGTWWFRLAAAGGVAFAAWHLLQFRERRRVEVALGRQALQDPLTGLANRALFRDRVDHALARLAREGRPGAAADGGGAGVAVLFLDLDNFKAVNDSSGHHAGDALLCAVAARLLNATRGCDTVARLGGDEFAVLLENARGAADARAVAERIEEALRAPVSLPNAKAGEARVGASVGIAFAEPGVDADALLRNADAAMYQAKADGKGRHAVFDPALVAAAAERQQLEYDLADALARGELALAYQPVVALDTGAVVKAEALLRWRHPGRGLVSPAQFIPIAEASGLIVELGRWVLEEACREAAGWPAGPDGLPRRVSVNVSGRQLLDPGLPGHVAGALAGAGLEASRLTLEITESVLMHDTDAAVAVLRALKALGVGVAVDDFGTGYSSLRYLQRFPVDVLKIDKSFVDGIARGGGHDAALARTIVALGEMLGLRTVAEGVEHEAQADALRAMGCQYGQGYLFARPTDGAGLRALLEGAASSAV